MGRAGLTKRIQARRWYARAFMAVNQRVCAAGTTASPNPLNVWTGRPSTANTWRLLDHPGHIVVEPLASGATLDDRIVQRPHARPCAIVGTISREDDLGRGRARSATSASAPRQAPAHPTRRANPPPYRSPPSPCASYHAHRLLHVVEPARRDCDALTTGFWNRSWCSQNGQPKPHAPASRERSPLERSPASPAPTTLATPRPAHVARSVRSMGTATGSGAIGFAPFDARLDRSGSPACGDRRSSGWSALLHRASGEARRRRSHRPLILPWRLRMRTVQPAQRGVHDVGGP